MAGLFDDLTDRPLKKSKLSIAGPDVYPQEAGQKEDELTPTIVKHGYQHISTINNTNDEHASAHDREISTNDLVGSFTKIHGRKKEHNTLSDNRSGKNKPLLNIKDNFWLVAPGRDNCDNWIKDLAGNSVSLSRLAKRVPIFNKKEDICALLFKHDVPFSRAIWFIKMTAAHAVAQAESKVKRKTVPDSANEWTVMLEKYLQSQLKKVTDLSVMTDDWMRQWVYVGRLAKYMFEEGLMDTHEFLSWIVDELEEVVKETQVVTAKLKLVLSEVMSYMDLIVQQQLLCRQLAYIMAIQLSGMIANASNAIERLHQLSRCPQHRPLVLVMSAILQAIVLRNHDALVWLNIDKAKSPILCGSALDLIPIPPSCLPMSHSPHNRQLRIKMREMEEQIAIRSRAVESHWCTDRGQLSSASKTVTRVLEVLEALESHDFDVIEPSNNLELLYKKIFPSHSPPCQSDDAIIELLCDWAVSSQRIGSHRAILVAQFLEQRQAQLYQEKVSDGNDNGDEYCLFQDLLFDYLSKKAPFLDESQRAATLPTFCNLVLLMSELIRLDVFSHDSYFCTLIAQGDLGIAPISQSSDVQRMDRSFQSIENESFGYRPSPDQPASVRSDVIPTNQAHTPMMATTPLGPRTPGAVTPGHVTIATPASVRSVGRPDDPGPTPLHHHSKHQQYALHFPVMQDESMLHESNQRLVALFGVGRARDDAKHMCKKMNKELSKMFSKRSTLDLVTGEKTKKKKDKDENVGFESAVGKMERLSFHDQHHLTWSCATAVLELFSSLLSNVSTSLPLIENVALLFDLLEKAANIHCLITLAVQICQDIASLEALLVNRPSPLSHSYTIQLALVLVGVIRKYHQVLLLNQQRICTVFDGLLNLVRKLWPIKQNFSAMRCVLAYLHTLHSSCQFLKVKFADKYGPFATKISELGLSNSSIDPSVANHHRGPAVLMELLENPKLKPWGSAFLEKTARLQDSETERYSFVCNAAIKIAECKDIDRLNDLCLLCAELNSAYPELSCDWLGVLKALCCPANFVQDCGFLDVLSCIDLNSSTVHDNLAVMTAILIARHCFTLEDLVAKVTIKSLVASLQPDAESEVNCRLTCHLLRRLFCASSFDNRQNNLSYFLRTMTDQRLIIGAQDSITIGPMVAILKALLLLSENAVAAPKKSKDDNIIKELLMDDSDDSDEEISIMVAGLSKKEQNGVEGLKSYAQRVLLEICGQEWVRHKFFKEPKALLVPDLLLDKMLTNKQAQQLIKMIAYKDGGQFPQDDEDDENEPELRANLIEILENMQHWTLRAVRLEFELLLEQAKSSHSDKNDLIDNMALAVMRVFRKEAEKVMPAARRSTSSEMSGIVLIPPLLSKLHSQIQGRVLKVASQELETANAFWCTNSKKTTKERGVILQRSTTLLGLPPFLSLILTCLQGEGEQQESLLSSLRTQLEKFVNNVKDAERARGLSFDDNYKMKTLIQEALHMRLGLIGGMIEAILENSNGIQDWAVLLTQLISHGVVDAYVNQELCTVTLDMLSVLIHSTLVIEQPEPEVFNFRTYQSLVKKLSKELGEKRSYSVLQVRTLLLLPKKCIKVTSCEPIRNRSSSNKRQGLKISGRQRISPWDILEGHRNPAPLSWPWFCTVKKEPQPLAYEETLRLLLSHTHSLIRDDGYYLKPLELPLEDLEPQEPRVDKPIPELVPEAPSIRTEPTKTKSRKKPKTQSRTAARQQLSGNQVANFRPDNNWLGGSPGGMYRQHLPSARFSMVATKPSHPGMMRPGGMSPGQYLEGSTMNMLPHTPLVRNNRLMMNMPTNHPAGYNYSSQAMMESAGTAGMMQSAASYPQAYAAAAAAGHMPQRPQQQQPPQQQQQQPGGPGYQPAQQYQQRMHSMTGGDMQGPSIGSMPSYGSPGQGFIPANQQHRIMQQRQMMMSGQQGQGIMAGQHAQGMMGKGQAMMGTAQGQGMMATQQSQPMMASQGQGLMNAQSGQSMMAGQQAQGMMVGQQTQGMMVGQQTQGMMGQQSQGMMATQQQPMMGVQQGQSMMGQQGQNILLSRQQSAPSQYGSYYHA